jgi:hypothetical protein
MLARGGVIGTYVLAPMHKKRKLRVVMSLPSLCKLPSVIFALDKIPMVIF